MEQQNPSVQALVDAHLRERQEKERGSYKQTSWRASSLGSCLTGVYLERLGHTPQEDFDDRTLRVFDVGRKVEDWIVDIIKEQVPYDTVIKTQDELYSKEYDIKGHYDLMLKPKNGDPIIYEIKSKHSRSFWYMEKKGQGPQRSHEYQLWTYLWLTETPQGRIVYVSKDDMAILEYPVFLNDEKLRGEVMAELNILNGAWRTKVAPKPITDETDWRVKYCRFHKECLTFNQ